jgi:signal transduction histidine kinase
MPRAAIQLTLVGLTLLLAGRAPARILWSDPAERTVHHTNAGLDILGGKVRRTNTNSGVLYFKFHVDPLSDSGSEPYYAGFQLFEHGQEHLGVGNALEAWAYSAFMASEKGPSNVVAGEYNLKSANSEPVNLGFYRPYELVEKDEPRTIVFKAQYVPGEDDLITVWLNPRLRRGASEENQPEQLTTRFKAPATFDEIHLVHGGGGNGWRMSDMAIATSFDDFVIVYFWETWWFRALAAAAVLLAVGTAVRLAERRKYLQRLQRVEQETALERERARIAQDLHDELGSSLTRISLLSDLVRADKDNPTQVESHASKLALSASQTVRSLEEIVWAVRPGSDTLQSLVDYITHVAGELFASGSARCRLDLPAELPALTLPPDVRHNIFLIVKESLNNTLRHAAATEVNLAIKVSPAELVIVVTDNGKGFDVAAAAAAGKRNGLENMRRRAQAVGGRLTLTSAPGTGTRMEFVYVFPD